MFPVGMFFGAAVGAAVTYVYKDDSTKARVGEATENLKNKVSSLIASFKAKPNESEDEMQNEVIDEVSQEATATEASAVEVVSTEETVTTTAKETPTKKPRGRTKSKDDA